MPSYSVAFHHATPHGVLTAVHIPDDPAPVPDVFLERLEPAEAALARTLKGYRQVQFTGGRIALRRACEQLGVRPPPLLSTSRGAPTLPPGYVGSVSHKRELAVGMVATDRGGTLGVDIEEYLPQRLAIEEHVTTEAERAEQGRLPLDRKWIAIILRFSIKESIYKAIDPYVHRYVGFHEVEVWPDLEGAARVDLALERGEGPFVAEARYAWLYGRILTTARVRRA